MAVCGLSVDGQRLTDRLNARELHIRLILKRHPERGLFQISDARLRDLGGSPHEALDPEWSIQAARKPWSRDHDFGDWPHCARAADAPRSPAPRHSSTTARSPR
jgi:hypothetical protein